MHLANKAGQIPKKALTHPAAVIEDRDIPH
jgi:hypothetical protein